MWDTAFFKGMGMGGSLIIAIGSQNAFLLKQGLQRKHVALCVLTCMACDILLISFGVGGMGQLLDAMPQCLLLMRIAGILFLLEYGRRAAVSAYQPSSIQVFVGSDAALSRSKTFLMALTLSLLNPHAWLDTVVLLGSVCAQQVGAKTYEFASGAMAASVLWFSALGLGAHLLTPLFSRPAAWRALNAAIALSMWGIAYSLIIF
ncbi:LysE/ArgO family amino acid transporter [Undibacterium sp. Di27W]|uniref:LysE/ArgO family amino acid transporter n=1 Tax=Undibacterium sp. Di27W TaxID=3413036 RepID=UPI003BF30BAA